MTKEQELRDKAWIEFWTRRPYTLKDERIRQAFFAGYDAARAQAVTATCYMCANPERYGPPEAVEGSLRLFHFQGPNKWNAGQCAAQPILEVV